MVLLKNMINVVIYLKGLEFYYYIGEFMGLLRRKINRDPHLRLADKYISRISDTLHNGARAPRDITLFNEASREIEEALRKYPNSPELHFSLAGTLYGAGRYEESIREYNKVLELDPNIKSPELRKLNGGDTKWYIISNLGLLEFELGNYEKSERMLKKAFDMKKDWKVLEMLAHVRGKIKEEKEQFNYA